MRSTNVSTTAGSISSPSSWRAVSAARISSGGTGPAAAVVAFPKGRGGAHRVDHGTDEPVRLLFVSTMLSPEVNEYPDSGKVWARTYAPGAEPGPTTPSSWGVPRRTSTTSTGSTTSEQGSRTPIPPRRRGGGARALWERSRAVPASARPSAGSRGARRISALVARDDAPAVGAWEAAGHGRDRGLARFVKTVEERHRALTLDELQ